MIEDNPGPPLEFGLLPNLKCIYFCEVYVSTLTIANVAGYPVMMPTRDSVLTVPENGEVLKLAHEHWKRLRIEHMWIRDLWKERKEGRGVRIVLRRVMEMEVQIEGGKGDENVVYAWHSVVDVDTRRVMKKGYLPHRRKGEELVYDYGEARWWRA